MKKSVISALIYGLFAKSAANIHKYAAIFNEHLEKSLSSNPGQVLDQYLTEDNNVEFDAPAQIITGKVSSQISYSGY